MQKCPGQDTRHWTAEDVTEARCAGCGKIMEFFKTEGSLRCPACRRRVTNPAVNPGCAEWCRHAAECLGSDPAVDEQKRQSK